MKYIKDFFYNFSDLIFALLITVVTVFIIYTNMQYLGNVENLGTSVNTTSNETVASKGVVDVTVNIPADINLDQLGDLLHSYGVVADVDAFKASFSQENVLITPGVYELEENMDYEEIKSILSLN